MSQESILNKKGYRERVYPSSFNLSVNNIISLKEMSIKKQRYMSGILEELILDHLPSFNDCKDLTRLDVISLIYKDDDRLVTEYEINEDYDRRNFTLCESASVRLTEYAQASGLSKTSIISTLIFNYL